MQVKEKYSSANYPNYSIEWGIPTKLEDAETKAIRNRYDNINGGFNHPGSSEILWKDFNEMVLQSIKYNQFSTDELSNILKEIGEHIKKLNFPSIP